MQTSMESFPNSKSNVDPKDLNTEHCYVHTCPTQSCTELLLSLHSSKLQLECQITKLQIEVKQLKLELAHTFEKENFRKDDESMPLLFYCCTQCDGLLPSREDYSKHTLSCCDTSLDYRCTYYKCECDIFQKYAINYQKNKGLTTRKQSKRKAPNKSPEGKAENPSDNPQSHICESQRTPRKRTRRKAAIKLLAKWGREVEGDVSDDSHTVKSLVSSTELQASLIMGEGCNVKKDVIKACSETKQTVDSENIASDTEEKMGGLTETVCEPVSASIETRKEDTGVMRNKESDSCSDMEVQRDGEDLNNAQTVISEERPQIRKLVRNSKSRRLKASEWRECRLSKQERERLKSIYQKYLTEHKTIASSSSDVCKVMYCCPKCPFVSQKCVIFHKHVTLHEIEESDGHQALKGEEDKLQEHGESEDTSKSRSRRQVYNQLRNEWAKTYEQFAVLEDNVFKHYQCPNCSYTSRNSGLFGRHFNNVHNQAGVEGADLWKCDICEFQTHRKAIFVQHKKSHDRPYLCNFCPRRFGNQKNLSDHIMIHTGVQPLKCPHCDYATKQKRCLQEHVRKHTGENLLCTSCSFTTVYQAAMAKHTLSKHMKKALHPCPECDYITNDRTNLLRHVQIHQKHKDFKCYQCRYEGVTKHDVLRHMRCHTQEKVYYCDRCDFSTAYPGALRTHLMIHLDVKPFKCSLCGYDASQKMRVIHHIKAKHSKSTAVVLDLGIKLNLDLKNYRCKPEVKGSEDVVDVLDCVSLDQVEDEERLEDADKIDQGTVGSAVIETMTVDEAEVTEVPQDISAICVNVVIDYSNVTV